MVKCSALDHRIHAIADPTRRDILERLSRGPASVSELAGPLSMSMPGVLKHVRILEDADLVRTEKRGRSRECRLGAASLDDVAGWVEQQRSRWEGRLDRLESYLAEKKEGTP